MATWDNTFNTSPAGSATPGEGDDRIRETRVEICNRVDQEHVFLNTASTGTAIHRAGSARAFYADYSDGVANEALDEETEPTLRPDGVTAIGANDTGRLRIDSGTGIIRFWNGTYWEKATVYDLDSFIAGQTASPEWHRLTDSSGGWIGSKVASWTAGYFPAAQGGYEIDFSGYITAGTTTILCMVRNGSSSTGYIFSRPKGEKTIAGGYCDVVHSGAASSSRVILHLDENGIAEFGVSDTSVDLYVSYPIAEYY